MGFGSAMVGCPSSSTTLPYTPYTGINFVSQLILAGVGCGPNPGQVLTYVVIIGDPNDAGTPNLSPLRDGGPGAYGSLVNCFANGIFASTSTAPDGGATVEGWIYAYDAHDFESMALSIPGIASCATATCPLSLSDMQAVIRTPSTYTTTCTANPESGDNVQASCLPLVAGESLDAGSDASAESTASDAAASDAAPSDATASDSAASDAAASESDAGDGAAVGD
jgi:hypothetical protein